MLAFSVSWRTREFAIRLALGAQPRRILAGVLIDGATIGGDWHCGRRPRGLGVVDAWPEITFRNSSFPARFR